MNILVTLAICLGAILGIIVLLLLIALIKTLLTPTRKAGYLPHPDPEREEMYAEILGEMIRCETVSYTNVNDPEKFRNFHKVLKKLFPLVFEKLDITDIEGNLLLHWKGRLSDRPLVLMSHQDTVPADGKWLHGPFSGVVAYGRVWGRGTSDTKASLMGFLQAVEELLKEDFVPEQDVYLCSSCTEEWSGPGCPMIVKELKKRGIRPYLVCDEGGGIITEPLPGIPGNFAMVGVVEKGMANVKFTAKGAGGHASSPENDTPITRLAEFICEVEKRKTFKKKLFPEVLAMFKTFAPYSGFGMKFIFTNLWLFKPILPTIMVGLSPRLGAMVRTTVAFTMQSGSENYNSIPGVATLGANVRFIPHQGMDESLAILEKLASKHKISMEVIEAVEYSKIADMKCDAYRMLDDTVKKTFPGIVASPYILAGGTDASFFDDICDTVVRFAPVIYGQEQLECIHAVNENIETNCLPGCIDFYKNLIFANK
ncbi:MAG: M20/M25/M40 family metallo-hydrolase [Lachnospiraceae bacterium]|nr:M20/M25/M40 family metallo-hydrolase [Lachnospiraceae bacterium]